jgi:hypothetical protein
MARETEQLKGALGGREQDPPKLGWVVEPAGLEFRAGESESVGRYRLVAVNREVTSPEFHDQRRIGVLDTVEFPGTVGVPSARIQLRVHPFVLISLHDGSVALVGLDVETPEVVPTGEPLEHVMVLRIVVSSNISFPRREPSEATDRHRERYRRSIAEADRRFRQQSRRLPAI